MVSKVTGEDTREYVARLSIPLSLLDNAWGNDWHELVRTYLEKQEAKEVELKTGILSSVFTCVPFLD